MRRWQIACSVGREGQVRLDERGIQAENPSPHEIAWARLPAAQNADGGWGYLAGQKSAAEPTSWGLLAICGGDGQEDARGEESKSRAASFLRSAQLRDGSWPAVMGQKEGGWVTSLACLALRVCDRESAETNRALDWLCQEWPGEGGWWWRVRRRLSGEADSVRQDHGLRGWSWTRGTSSWVEPTAFALFALRGACDSHAVVQSIARRQKLAQAMLCDRMCPGGGWNCGNPSVYGVAGKPQVGPTVWALLALAEFEREATVRDCIRQSLDWLERTSGEIRGRGSLALARIGLRAFGHNGAPLDPQIVRPDEDRQLAATIPVLAWQAMALGPTPGWLRPRVTGSY